jgi:uncharacterized integral membrane protein
MGDTKGFQSLTKWDKISVTLYRLGIVISMFCFIYAVVALYFFSSGVLDHSVLKEGIPNLVLWTFLISVGLSLSLLHLYSKPILRIIQSFWFISVIIFVFLAFSSTQGRFIDNILNDGLGIIGWGFLLAAFSGIGAKEAFCFKLYEGYLFGILNAILVLGNLLSIFSPSMSFALLTIITFLVTLFTIRKLQNPIHYDIGDKSRY